MIEEIHLHTKVAGSVGGISFNLCSPRLLNIPFAEPHVSTPDSCRLLWTIISAHQNLKKSLATHK